MRETILWKGWHLNLRASCTQRELMLVGIPMATIEIVECWVNWDERYGGCHG